MMPGNDAHRPSTLCGNCAVERKPGLPVKVTTHTHAYILVSYLVGGHQIFDAVIESEVDHVERAVATDRRRDAFVEAAQPETVGAHDLPRHAPRGRRLLRTETIGVRVELNVSIRSVPFRPTTCLQCGVRLHRHLDHFERIDDDGLGNAGTQTGQRVRLQVLCTKRMDGDG